MDINSIAAVAMQRDLTRMNVISQNIANVTTPGFKKIIPSVFSGQMAAMNSAAPSANNEMPTLDMTQGTLRPTGNSSDIVMEGGGFLEVVTPTGPAYTRQGALHINVDGVLVGTQDMPVAGQSGGPLQLQNLPFSIASNGDVSQGGRVIGQLRIVQFERAANMSVIGAGLYGQGAAQIAPPGGRSTIVRSGFLEASNVSSPQEMVRLSETVRHFESMQRVIQGYDESLDNAIRKLGDF